MNIGRCPGQDRINWTPDDIFEIRRPSCGGSIEFFIDDRAQNLFELR